MLNFGAGVVKGTAGFVGASTVALTQAGVDFATRKSDKDIDIIDAFNSAKGKVFGKIDDGIYNITGERSLRLGLEKLKETDPELYERAKKAIKDNSAYKKQVLKRSVKNGIAPVLTMAKIFAGIPMAIIDPKEAIPLLATNFSNLKSESASRRKRMYGHKSKTEIKGRRGRTIANVLTLGTYGAVANNIETVNNDLEKVRKKQKAVIDLRHEATEVREDYDKINKLRGEEQKISNELDSNVKEKDVDTYQELKANMLKTAMESVVHGGDIKKP